jgi:hypothetical protein
MPEEEHNGATGGEQASEPEAEILYPDTVEAVMWGAEDVTEEMRVAMGHMLLWRHMSDDERRIVVEAWMSLTTMDKRGFKDWLKIGEGVHYLQQEVEEQAGSSSGRRYNRAWQELAPPPMREFTANMRSRCVWLWRNKDVLLAWWETVDADKRRRWNHPYTIQLNYERHRPNAWTNPPHGEEAEHSPRRSTAADRRSNRSAMADMIRDAHGTVDEMRDFVRQIGGDSPLFYDLSSPSLVYESADNFHQVYGGVHGDAAVQQFSEAIRDILQDARVWVPGSNFDNDSDDEIALYLYRRLQPGERAMRIARKVAALWQAERRRGSSVTPRADIDPADIEIEPDATMLNNVVPFNGPTPRFGFRRLN